MKKKVSTWLVGTIYYHESSWNQLLTYSIKPLVEELLDKRYISQFFYYNNNFDQPYVRLLVKGEKDVLDTTVKKKFEKVIRNFLRENPSKEFKVKLPVNNWFMPPQNNGLVFYRYFPDVVNLGGLKATEVAEELFHSSSSIILKHHLLSSEGWDISQANNVSYIMAVCLIHSTGMTISEAALYTEQLFDNNLGRVEYIPSKDEKKRAYFLEHLLKAKEILRTNFVENQQESIGFLEYLWDCLDSNNPFEEDWINDWIAECKTMEIALEGLLQSDELNLKRFYKSNSAISVSEGRQKKWMIYNYYIVFVSRQLGVHEAHLLNTLYTISQSFHNLAKESKVYS